MFSVATAYFTLKADITSNTERITSHDQRLLQLETGQTAVITTLNDIRRDMAVVRYQLEKKVDKEDVK